MQIFIMLALLFIPCIFLLCIHLLMMWNGRRARKLFKGLPTYPALPFIGNFHQIFGNARFIMKMLNDVAKIKNDTGLPFVAWAGPIPLIIVADPEDVKAVTNAFIEKPYYYSFAKDWVGDGLVTAPAHIWKRNIKMLAGTFTGSIVEGYQDIFNAQAQKLVDNLKKEVGGKPFDVLNGYLAYATLETICQTALGVPKISDSIVTCEYYTAFRRAFELFIERGMKLFLHFDWVYQLTPAHKELKRCVAVLHNVSNTIITKKIKEREEMKRNGTLPSIDSANGKTRFKSFLDIIFDHREADPSLTIQQIRNEVDTIIVGGQETVAVTLFLALMVIGTKTEIQEKIYAELTEIFGSDKRPIQKDDLALMRYTEAVILETLRVYPPLPAVMRMADKDLQIKSCTIPKGTVCAVNNWAASRSPRAWGPDAEVFRPERWLDDPDLIRTNSASFLAFSYGKRACIGRRYAIPLTKTMLAYIVRDLRVTSTLDKLQLKVDVTLKPETGHLITVKHRN